MPIPLRDPRAITPGIPATLPIDTNQAGADMDGSQFPVTFIDQWHGLLEPRDPGAVPSPVGRLEARDRWRNGWDAAGAVVPRRRKGPAFGTGIGGAARLAPSVM